MKQILRRWNLGAILAGSSAGIVNGLFGAGGGMVLLPLLSKTTKLRSDEQFASCVCIILPLSMISAAIYFLRGGSFGAAAVPYLLGGALGGIIAGLVLKRLSPTLLHRALGIFILWGGLRLVMS